MEAQQPFDWMTPLTATLAAAGGYLVRLIFDRKKVKAEDDSAQLDADTKAVELYERFASNLAPKIEALQNKQEELFNTVSSLKIENADLKIENKELKAENQRLKIEIADLHTQVDELKNRLQ